jgi:hypothetical protein
MAAEFDLAPRWSKGRLRPLALNSLLRIAFSAVVVFLSARWLIVWLPRYLPRDWANAHERDALVDWKAARLFSRIVRALTRRRYRSGRDRIRPSPVRHQRTEFRSSTGR